MNPPTTQKTPSLTTGGKSDPFPPQLLNAINQATEIDITVAFIRQSGLDLIFEALKDAMDRSAVIQVLTPPPDAGGGYLFSYPARGECGLLHR